MSFRSPNSSAGRDHPVEHYRPIIDNPVDDVVPRYDSQQDLHSIWELGALSIDQRNFQKLLTWL